MSIEPLLVTAAVLFICLEEESSPDLGADLYLMRDRLLKAFLPATEVDLISPKSQASKLHPSSVGFFKRSVMKEKEAFAGFEGPLAILVAISVDAYPASPFLLYMNFESRTSLLTP